MNDKYLPAAVWTYPDVLGLFFGGLAGSVFLIVIATALNGAELSSVPQLIAAATGQAAAIVGILAYMSKTRGTASWDLDFGLRFKASDLLGILYGFGLQIAVLLLVQVPLAWLLSIEDPPEQDVSLIAGEASSLVAKVAVFIVLVILAPLTEELVYRGVLLSRLRRGFSKHAAVAISALVFSGIHLVDPSAAFVVPGLFVIGLVLGYQALHTDRIGLAITTHAGVNLLAAIAILADLDV